MYMQLGFKTELLKISSERYCTHYQLQKEAEAYDIIIQFIFAIGL